MPEAPVTTLLPADVLVVDDEFSMRQFLQILLDREGYGVHTATSGEEALQIMKSHDFDLVLTDLSMPGIDGIELVRHIRSGSQSEHGTDVPVVLVTAYGTTENAVLAMKEGANDYVCKPFNNDELLMVIRKAIDRKALEELNLQLRGELKQRYSFHNLIGTSSRMKEVYRMIKRVRDSRISCLLCGKSGTGKEVVARSIHYTGARAAEPFVPVNCGAIPEGLMESELFGYKRGAFTGANRDKEGFFGAAHRGTLFLDEIGEMPLHTQVKLLRAIAERKVTRVGDTVEREVDVRIIAATNRELQDEVAEGRFREDLFYRLNVVRIDLPELRDRKEDIELLAEHFVREYSREYGKTMRGVSAPVREQLLDYAWPGNVRELRNVIEGAVALEEESQITLRSLPRQIIGAEMMPSTLSASKALQQLPESGMNLDGMLGNIEQDYLEQALERAEGNKTQAAKLLGMSFRSFRYRLAKYGLDET